MPCGSCRSREPAPLATDLTRAGSCRPDANRAPERKNSSVTGVPARLHASLEVLPVDRDERELGAALFGADGGPHAFVDVATPLSFCSRKRAMGRLRRFELSKIVATDVRRQGRCSEDTDAHHRFPRPAITDTLVTCIIWSLRRRWGDRGAYREQ